MEGLLMTIKNLSAIALAGAGLLAQGQTGSQAGAPAAPQTQAAPAPTVTAVMVMLTTKSGVAREDVMKVLPEEVRETVKLYLGGKIEQWYGRGDGRGVVFFLRCGTVDEAKAIMAGLPLHATGYMDEEYVPVGPLAPLRFLVAQQQGGSAPGR
jgi:hypothetical protein